MKKQHNSLCVLWIVIGVVFYFVSCFIFENKIDMYFNQICALMMIATFIIFDKIEIAEQNIKDFIKDRYRKE